MNKSNKLERLKKTHFEASLIFVSKYAMKFSTTTFRLMALSIMTFSIMDLIVILSINNI